MYEVIIARVDADMRYRPVVQPEEQQVTRFYMPEWYALCMVQLRGCRARHANTGLAVGIVDQPAAIETTWRGTAVAIRRTHQRGRDGCARVLRQTGFSVCARAALGIVRFRGTARTHHDQGGHEHKKQSVDVPCPHRILTPGAVVTACIGRARMLLESQALYQAFRLAAFQRVRHW